MQALAEQRAENEKLEREGVRDQKRLAKLDRLDQYTDYLRTRFSLFGSNGQKREMSVPTGSAEEDENSFCMSVSNTSSTDLASNAEDTRKEATEALTTTAAAPRSKQGPQSNTSASEQEEEIHASERAARDESGDLSMEIEPMIAYPDGSTLWEIIIDEQLAVEFELILKGGQPKIKSITNLTRGDEGYGRYDDELHVGDEVLELDGANVPPGTTPEEMSKLLVKAMPLGGKPLAVEILVFRPSPAAGRDRSLAEQGLAPKSGVLSYNPCLA